MGFMASCSVLCMLLSIWGVIQLTLMAIFYDMEATVLIEDVEAHEHEYNEYYEYITKTKLNYAATGTNCWYAAMAYIVTLILSIICLCQANIMNKKKAAKLEDDELNCIPPEPKLNKRWCKKKPKDALTDPV